MKNNNNAGKREIRFDTHRRRPGRAKFWKHLSNRKGRRWGARLNKQMVEGRREIL